MSIVRITLKQEIKELIEKSVKYVEQRKTAKTDVKRNYYTKKLKKNNQALEELLVAYDRLSKDEEKGEDSNESTK